MRSLFTIQERSENGYGQEWAPGMDFRVQAPVVQRPDNFIQWISHYPTVSVCAKISVFPRVQANMHTLTTAKFGSV